MDNNRVTLNNNSMEDFRHEDGGGGDRVPLEGSQTCNSSHNDPENTESTENQQEVHQRDEREVLQEEPETQQTDTANSHHTEDSHEMDSGVNVQNPEDEDPLSVMRNPGGPHESASSSEEKPDDERIVIYLGGQIAQYWSNVKTYMKNDSWSRKKSKKMCTIITQHPESNVLQLVKYLSDISVFDDGSLCWYNSPDDEEIWKSCADKVDKSSIIILYHSYSLETPLPDLSDMEKLLDYCRRKHDPEKIKVVISGMEDENLERQIIDRWKVGRYRDWELLTFTKAEMRCLIEQKINPLSAERRLVNKLRHMYKIVQEAADPARNAIVKDSDSKPDIEEKSEVSFKGNMDKIRKIVESTRQKKWWLFTKPHMVGIFSRSSESDYEWIIKQLKSESFRNIVSTAIPHSISNNGMRKFMDAVSRCTFGILYHTKNRGRINIVDVTNSLYDEELKYLSKHLGKEKVIVVVDDLEDTTDGEKRRILETQPSIGTLARDLFLFNANDNKKL